MSFFNQNVAPNKTSVSKQDNCSLCKLHETCTSPKLRLFGDGNKKVLIVGPYPYKEEDRIGIYGRDKEMYFLIDQLESIGINFEQDCWYTTAVNCRPPKAASTKNIQYCRPRLMSLIDKLQPKSIILLGETAFDSLIGPRLTGRITGTSFNAFVGETIPDQELKRWICPIWPVSYLFSKKQYDDGNYGKALYEKDPSVLMMWKKHVQNAFTVAAQPFYTYKYDTDVFTTTDVKQAIEWLNNALTWGKMAFDYETSGRKPHRKGHKIHSVSISDGCFSYCFPFFDNAEFRDLWKKLMLSPVQKIGQNIQFEMLWTKELLGYWPMNWIWDTMLAQHCVNNQKPTGLKYITYIDLGIIGYDDEVDAYLKSDKFDEDIHGGNAFNHVDDASLEKSLFYCGLDSLFTYKIYEIQKGKLSEEQLKGNAFLCESTQTLIKVTQNGMCIDEDMLAKTEKQLQEAMQKSHEKIMGSEEVKKWDKDTPFNYMSSTQLSHLLYDVLKIKPLSTTPGGKPSVDKDALPKINLPFIKDILEYRRLGKILDTYIHQYKQETVDGKIHPFFNLNRVDTFRSSCDGPNIQNLPKRDEQAMQLLRSFVKPRKGNCLYEADYQSLEICINACYSGDKNLIKYITTPGSDMHRDAAVDCYMLPAEQITKKMRNSVKGQLNFAAFYGSYYKQMAPDLWESVKELDLQEHLRGKGIHSYRDFEKHIEEVERILWEERFPEHNSWRKDQWIFYQKHGYINTYTGFQLQGVMGRNNTFNGCVQGSGFHILMYMMNKVNKKVEKLERSFVVGEIHDSLVLDVHPSEESLIDYWIWYYGTQEVREAWPWITVPLRIEKASSEIDGAWSNMTERGFLKGE